VFLSIGKVIIIVGALAKNGSWYLADWLTFFDYKTN
jgi:hypothetical protein